MTGGGGYSGFDPIEDTERYFQTIWAAMFGKSYSGFDPIEDTESSRYARVHSSQQ